MSEHIQVEVDLWKNEKRINSLTFKRKNRKVLTARYLYENGVFIGLNLSGKEIPTTAELLRVVNQRFLDNIHNIGNIENIETIQDIQSVKIMGAFNNNIIKNGDFETVLGSGWKSVSGTEERTADYAHSGIYGLKQQLNAQLYQYLPPYYGDEIVFSAWCYSPTAARTFNIFVVFSDGTTESTTYTIVATDTWEYFTFAPTTHKRIATLYITNLVGTSGSFGYWDDINAYLLNRPVSREDLSFKRFAHSFGAAADWVLLAAVASQHHKVYAYSLRVSAAIETEFRDGTDAEKQFGVDNVAGLRMQTLLHPFVGTANTALNVRSEGICDVIGWIQYATEA